MIVEMTMNGSGQEDFEGLQSHLFATSDREKGVDMARVLSVLAPRDNNNNA